MFDSIAPKPSEAVAAHIRALQQLTFEIDAALRGRGLQASSRARMAFGCLDLAVEHTSGIAVLADQPLWGTVFALLRVQLEAFIRGVWLARCATDPHRRQSAIGPEAVIYLRPFDFHKADAGAHLEGRDVPLGTSRLTLKVDHPMGAVHISRKN